MPLDARGSLDIKICQFCCIAQCTPKLLSFLWLDFWDFQRVLRLLSVSTRKKGPWLKACPINVPLKCRYTIFLRGAGGFSASSQPFSYSKRTTNLPKTIAGPKVLKSGQLEGPPDVVFHDQTRPSQVRNDSGFLPQMPTFVITWFWF